jgi:hypothetical protein
MFGIYPQTSNCVTPWYSAILENLTVNQMVKNSLILKTQRFVIIGSYPEPIESSLHLYILFKTDFNSALPPFS